MSELGQWGATLMTVCSQYKKKSAFKRGIKRRDAAPAASSPGTSAANAGAGE